jgi:hydrogenase maturation protease
MPELSPPGSPAGEAERIVALGLGNVLNRDEGWGVRCLELLEPRFDRAAGVDFLDGGVLGMDLMPLVERSDALLLLDAVDARKPPGTIIELDGPDIPLYAQVKLSIHQVTFQEVLFLAKVRNRLPRRLHLIGVQPADMGVGLDMSPAAGAALAEGVERAARVLVEWGVAANERT